MSKLGKIFLWISVPGILLSAAFGYLVITKYNDTRTTLTQTQTSLEDQKKATAKAVAETQAVTEAKALVDKQLSDSQAANADLNSKLAAAQKQADDITATLTSTKADLAKAQSDLQHINDLFSPLSPEDYKTAKEKADNDLKASQDEQTILEQSLKVSQADVARLHILINNSNNHQEPPGVSGRVTVVNRTWNFVVLDVGLADGVVPNGELIVFRNNSFLGKVKVTRAEEHTSVADIMPETKGDIQEGDFVLN
jgi:hypothetical protein